MTMGSCLSVYAFLGRDEIHVSRQGKSLFPSRDDWPGKKGFRLGMVWEDES